MSATSGTSATIVVENAGKTHWFSVELPQPSPMASVADPGDESAIDFPFSDAVAWMTGHGAVSSNGEPFPETVSL